MKIYLHDISRLHSHNQRGGCKSVLNRTERVPLDMKIPSLDIEEAERGAHYLLLSRLCSRSGRPLGRYSEEFCDHGLVSRDSGDMAPGSYP